ncbi:MAG: hypothetical protein R3B84_12285 [Zavarzinella sp.]
MNNYTTLLLVSSIILLITNEAYPEELPPKTEPSISQFERIFPAKISPSYSVVNYPGMKDYKVPIYRLHDTVTDANLSKQYIYQSPYGLDLTRSKTTSRALASLTAQKSLILLEVPSRIVDNTFITNIKLLPNVRMLVIRNELNVTAANYQQLVNLNNLASISITSRTLTDQHITMLAKNPTLQEIFINSQFLTDRAINILSQMPNLTGIGSNSPKITDSGIAKLAQLPNLETIYFPEKSIGKLSVQAFDQADKTHLLPWFRNNEGTKPKSREDITAINFERDTNPDFLNHIRALPNVKRFHFPPGYINDKLIDILSMNKLLHVMFDIKTNNGQKIIDVNTSNLRLPTRIFTAFFDFDDVEVINMPIFSSIDSKDFVHLTKLTKLKEVSFQGSNISGIALREIIKHPTLSVLRLVDCKLNKEEAVALAGAKNLQTLHISDTNLAYFDAALLSRTSITELTLTNCVEALSFFLLYLRQSR